MLEQKGKILSTLESIKQQTGTIVTICFPLVSFLNVLAKYLTFLKSNACTCQDMSTASNGSPVKFSSIKIWLPISFTVFT